MRALARVLLVLLVVVTTTSAWVRLAQAGLSCAGAPACYASQSARAGADRSTSVAVARTLHRLAASAAGAVIIALFFFGWRAGGSAERAAVVALALLAIGLATLGRHTPSPLPAVTLANLLGGFAMVALSAWLASRLARRPPERAAHRLRPWTWLAILFVALQAAAGAMIAARHAAFACATLPLCDGAAWPAGTVGAAFDPLRESPPPADASERAGPSRQAVLLAHRALAVPTALLLAWLGAAALAAGLRGPGRALLALVAVQLALGLALSLAGVPLLLAVAHNLAAAAVVIVLGTLAARTG